MSIKDRTTPIIAVDFDGTIASNSYPEIGEELPGALESLKEMQAAGCFIIIWTCRHSFNLRDAVDWLEKRGFIPDAVNEHAPDIIPGQEQKRKVFANLYLDDKSFPPFPGWIEFMLWFREEMKERLSEESK